MIETVDRADGRPSSPTSAWQSDIVAGLTPLWVGGAALLCLMLVSLAKAALPQAPLGADVWAQYLTLGAVVPAIVAANVLVTRSGRRLPALLEPFLVVLAIVLTAIAAGSRHSAIAIGLALVQTCTCLVTAGRQALPVRITRARQSPPDAITATATTPIAFAARDALSLVVMGFFGWVVVLEILTWNELVEVLPSMVVVAIVGAVALIACCWWAFRGERTASDGLGWRQRLADIVCLLVLALLAFRTDGLFTTDRLGELGTFLHWGAFVGPAEVVRQGGWPLWDVPLQYGFLTTVSLAALPVATSWQALYLLNAVGSLLVGCFLFFILRATLQSVAGSGIAVAVTAAVVFLLPAWAPRLIPMHAYPSVGVMRFFWCYVLVAVLLLERRQPPGSRAQKLALVAGSLGWVAAVLWSAESAFYSSAFFVPAFVAIVLRDHVGSRGARDWRRALAWLAIPPLLLAAAIGAIVAIYRQLLGHLPDGLAYFDAVLAFSGSFRLEIDARWFGGMEPSSTIVVVLFGFLLLVMAAAAIAKTTAGPRDLPLVIGLAFGTWGLSSYPVGLPWAHAIFRQMPLLVLALGIVIGVVAPRYRRAETTSWVELFKAGAVPILVALLVTAYSNVADLQYTAEAIRGEEFRGRDVTVNLPRVDPSLATLLQQTGVLATDPIFYAGAKYGDMMPVWVPDGSDTPVVVSRSWMPAPLTVLAILPDERKQRYMERYAARRDQGGWFIERRRNDAVVELAFPLDSWFFEQLDRTHTPTKIAQDTNWQLVWYEPKGGAEPAAHPGQRSGRVPGLPEDLLVNGEALAGSVLPPVWGYFGPEWTDPAVDREARCTNGPGTLHIFAPSPRDAWVTLEPHRGGFAGPLQVAANESAPVAAVGRRKDLVESPVSLHAGWNTLTIAQIGGDQPATAADPRDACTATAPAHPPLRVKSVDLRFEADAQGSG